MAEMLQQCNGLILAAHGNDLDACRAGIAEVPV
jgi:hypothetical protein